MVNDVFIHADVACLTIAKITEASEGHQGHWVETWADQHFAKIASSEHGVAIKFLDEVRSNDPHGDVWEMLSATHSLELH